MKNKNIFAHMLAIMTILIWGTTYISTKVLLTKLSPVEILAYRFITALIVHFTGKDERVSVNLILGFIVAMTGIFIVIYNGKLMKLNPVGDIIAISSSVLFSVYSILIRKVNKAYSKLFVVRKTFFYGVITILPILIITRTDFHNVPNLNINMISNLLFLSIFASVLCFIMWNKAIEIIGSVKTTNYIYFVPLITMITSAVILNEKVSKLMILGGCLIFLGVYINQSSIINNLFSIRKKRI